MTGRAAARSAARTAARAADGSPGQSTASQQPEPRNEILLVGRLSAPAQERTLPSGDVLLTWRVVVSRPPGSRVARDGARQVTVDTIDCVARAAGVRRTVGAFSAGDVLQVVGALHRRFWRSGSGGLASRYEVEVKAVKRVARAATP